MEIVGAELEVLDHPGLKCSVRGLKYDFVSRRGLLWMADGNCTDMNGCIKLFEAIDPDVVFITTIAGMKMDTRYVRTGGKWKAIMHR